MAWQKFISLFQSLYTNGKNWVRAYCSLPPEFTARSGVLQGCPLLFNLVIVMAVEISLFSCENTGIGICSDRKLSGLDYAHNVVLLTEHPNKLQGFPDHLVYSVGKFGVVQIRVLCFNRATVKWINLAIFIVTPPVGCRRAYELFWCIWNVRLPFTNLKHLWGRRGIHLLMSDRVCAAELGSLLLCGSEIWSLRTVCV